MNLEPLYNQIALLNENITTLIGAIAATGGMQPQAQAQLEPQAATETKSEASKASRPKTRYYRLSSGTVVKSSGDTPAGATEISKDDYDAANLAAAKTATDAKGTSAGNAASDPFSDDKAPAVTLDDIRTLAFKLRDTKGADAAKAIIEKFATKLAEVKPEQFGKLSAALKDALNGVGDDL